jgi:hypothetical protein
MWFSELKRQDRILQITQFIQNRLVQTRVAMRAGETERAEQLLSDSLNDLIGVIQHLQNHYAVAPIPHPLHEPVVLWQDRATVDRLAELSQQTGYSPRQCLIDLLQRGQLPDDTPSGDADD